MIRASTLPGRSAGRRWLFLLLLLVASLTTAATIHARELSQSVSIECTGTVHSDGDSDQRPGDGDSAVPHHHGACPGPVMSLPSVFDDMPEQVAQRSLPVPESARMLPSRAIDPALRPPNA